MLELLDIILQFISQYGIIILTLILCCYITIQLLNRKYIDIMEKMFRMPLPICIISSNINKLLFSNDKFKELFLTDETKDVKNIFKLNIFYEISDYLQIKQEVENNIVNKRFINMIINGEIRYFEVLYFPLMNKILKNNIVLAFAECNVTEQYMKHLGVFSSVMDESPDGIIVAKYINDESTPTIMYANQAIEDITGYEADTLINKPLTTIYYLNVDKDIFNEIEENIKNPQKFSIKYQYTKRNGGTCWLQSEFNVIDNKKIDKALSHLSIPYNANEMPDMSKDIYITLHQVDISANKFNEKEYQKQIETEEHNYDFISKYLNIVSENKPKDIIVADIFEHISKTFNAPRIFTIEFDNNLNFSINYEYLSNDIESMNTIVSSYNMNIEESGLIEIYGYLCNKIPIRINEKSTEKFYKYMEDYWYMVWKNTSSLLIPVVIDSELKMVITLCDYDNNRMWDKGEEKLLSSIAVNTYKLLKA